MSVVETVFAFVMGVCAVLFAVRVLYLRSLGDDQ